MRDLVLLVFLAGTLLTTFRYPFAALLLWAWFTLATPQAASYWAGALSLNTIIAGTTFLAFFIHGEFGRIRITALTWIMALFTVWLWVAQMDSLSPAFSGVLFDRFLKIMIFVVLCAVSVNSRLRFHALLWMLVLVMGFYGAKGGFYTLLTLGQNKYFGLDGTILFDNNHLGIALATTLPMFLYLIRQVARPEVRWGIWGVFGLSIIAIIGTHSRGALIALVAFGGLMWLRSSNKILSGIAIAMVGVATLQFAPAEWTERMETISEAGEDASFMGRFEAWVINYRLANENPLTGVGLRVPYIQDVADTVADYQARAAHSIYFEVLGGTGYVGLLLYLSLLGLAFLQAGNAKKKYAHDLEGSWRVPFGRYAQMSLVIFGIAGASVSMEMWEGYLIIIALIAALPNIDTKASTSTANFKARRIKERTGLDIRKRVRDRMPEQEAKSKVDP